nr:aminoglycoside phosphotransferase family protein [Kineosporia babensis]
MPVTFAASGWDNQLWRLGEELAVRAPWATHHAGALLVKEYTYLPELSRTLPLKTPVPQRLGRPSESFDHPWIVTTWVEGEPADRAPVTKGIESADRLAAFLTALHQPAPSDAPADADRRGVPLAAVDHGFRRFRQQVPAQAEALTEIWEDALQAPVWDGPPMWVHADLHAANVLTEDGNICGIIDFGALCAGDPAVDLAGAWLLLPTEGIDHFSAQLDDATRRRARGWATLKALACLSIGTDTGPGGKPSWAPPARAALTYLVGLSCGSLPTAGHP